MGRSSRKTAATVLVIDCLHHRQILCSLALMGLLQHASKQICHVTRCKPTRMRGLISACCLDPGRIVNSSIGRSTCRIKLSDA